MALLLLLLQAVPDLGEQIDALRNRHGLRDARISLMIASAETGEVLCSLNGETRLIPASNVKLVTSAFALETLGEDFEYRTELYVDGRIRGDTIEGNLVVRADGDPNFSGRFFDSPTGVFERWARILGGVRKMTGELILVDDHFERLETHPDWAEEDLSRWYCAPVRGFAFNDNCVDFKVGPGRPGGRCRITMCPETGYVVVDNGTRTVAGTPRRPVAFWRRPGTNVIVLRGERGPRSPWISFSCTVKNPTRYFGTVMLEVLGLNAPIREADQLPATLCGKRPIAIQSFGLARTLQVCNRRSHNLYAEMLLKRAGGGSWEKASKAVETWLAGIGRKGATIRDGSGLSRKNRLSAADLIAVLRHMRGSKIFRDSLAVPGDKGGTLRHRLKDLRGRLWAKTGHLAGVSSLSGYVVTEGGEPLVFSILVNGRGAKDRFQDDVVRRVAALTLD